MNGYPHLFHGTDVRCNLCYLIYSRHLTRLGKVTNFFCQKRSFFPSNVRNMFWATIPVPWSWDWIRRRTSQKSPRFRTNSCELNHFIQLFPRWLISSVLSKYFFGTLSKQLYQYSITCLTSTARNVKSCKIKFAFLFQILRGSMPFPRPLIMNKIMLN